MTRWPVVLVFGALPTVGLVAGPSYAVLIFGLAVVQLINLAVVERRAPSVTIDLGLCLLAAAFVTLCWASTQWSIDPAHSRRAALQMTAILLGAMALLVGPPLDNETADRLFRTLLIATIVGAAILAVDCLLDYRFQSLVAGRPHPDVATKYNRGIDYLVLIAWPQFAYIAWRRRWRDAVLLAACMVVILAIGASLAARVAAAAGIVVLALAIWLPRAIAAILTAGSVVLAASLPFTMRAMADHRMALAPHLKVSGLQRLEIWDYMTARVFEHPLLGWGIAISNAVPITPAEISTYAYQRTQGTYPHNQWLELWVETGAIGAALGLAFALLMIVRIRRLAPPVRPFAYAAFASAITVSCVNFEVVTDSWWAALAATAYLLTMLHHRVGHVDTA